MSRLNAELDQINKLSKGEGSSKDLRTMLVCAGVIGGLILLSNAGRRPDEGMSVKSLSGPLSLYVVQAETQDQVSCRAVACTYPVVKPEVARLSELRMARYAAPPVRTIAAPTGRVFRSTRSFSFDWQTAGVKDADGYTLVEFSLADEGMDGGIPDSGEPVKVPTPGYVRSAKLANTGQQISLSGAGADASRNEGATGQKRLRSDNPVLSAVEFQPFDKTMNFELADASAVSLEPGDSVKLRFDQAAASGQDGATMPVERGDGMAQVIKLSRKESSGILNLQVALSDDQAYRLLRDRVEVEKTLGQSAFPEPMRLELFPAYGRGADQLVRVPVSAIVRDAHDSYVWMVVDEFAIPVWVQEIKRDEQFAVVAEKSGARGLPIRPVHWRLLSGYARSRVFHAAHNLDNVKMNKLLGPSIRIIEQPDDKLQAGSKVRSLNAPAT